MGQPFFRTFDGEMITKNTIKQITSLRQQKFRKELGLFVVEGRKMTEELLQSEFEVEHLFATERFLTDCPTPLARAEMVSETQMIQMSGQDTPAGILAVVRIPKSRPLNETASFILALDGIANPGNMGTIIRTAEWFGINDIVCSPDCVEPWNPKVIQATMGSIFRVNVLEVELPDFLQKQNQKEKAIYGALLEGRDIFEMTKPNSGIIVIGSESHGIRADVLPCITHPITIPHRNNSVTESLNASVAAAIIMAQMTR